VPELQELETIEAVLRWKGALGDVAAQQFVSDIIPGFALAL
jgi:hypothetical protein